MPPALILFSLVKLQPDSIVYLYFLSLTWLSGQELCCLTLCFDVAGARGDGFGFRGPTSSRVGDKEGALHRIMLYLELAPPNQIN
jgi:hypothetical protein